MGTVRILVVDDSPFSRTLIADVLREQGYEVVAEAESLETMLTAYREYQPDIVTMDIAMPGADGFACSKALRLHDPKARIILVSSMKDEESEAEARRVGVMGYVQKPVEGEVIARVISGILAPDALYSKLMKNGLEIFKESLAQNITRMTKLPVVFGPEQTEEAQFVSRGITAVIGITGRDTGTMIMDLSPEAAEKITEHVLRRPAGGREEVLAMVAEFANIVAGVACSLLNNMDKGFSLRVSPPSLFYGAAAEIASPSMQVRGVSAEADFGQIYLGVGFRKGSVLWM